MNSANRDAKKIFGEALKLTAPEQRRAYLDKECAGDPALREDMESLLSAHAQIEAGGFMEQTLPLPAPDFLTEPPGTLIGRYKLLEQIGEGGFGVVYMAEQTEPVQRKVALKILKPGMDSRQIVARFEAERQALALMDHPNIAKVLDAGATETGRPYFVMELVRGIPITDYCDQKALSTTERLQLFIQVCHAVQHAHQKAIIHRDLKPSNVMVTLHDGKPVPKVIDFGVAKALGQKLTEKTLFTRFTQLLGTPAYMSPEQAELSGLDVDTRSDIYSLGVLLYELLTGVTPFDKETLAKAALDEVRRIIRETEPPRPSSRLQTLGNKLGEVAKHRHAEPAALSHLVRGDLDWIVMKCLEKDRGRRYETPDALATDVTRHLHQEPVMAAAPTIGYRLGKFARRHRAAFATALALSSFLVVATGVSLCGWLRARENLRVAYLAEARASRRTGTAGQRFDTLEAVRKAAAIRPSTELRSEAANALALPDLRVVRQLDNPPNTTLTGMDLQGEYYARGAVDGTISVRRIADDREIWAFPGRGGSVDWVLRFSADGRFLAATENPTDQRYLRVWNLQSGTLVLDTPLAVRYGAFDFQPNSAVIVTADVAGSVHWFDLETGRRWSWERKVRDAYTLRFRRDGQQIAVSSLGRPGVAICEAASGKLIAELPHPCGVRYLDWSADGHWLAAPCGDEDIYVWDVSEKPRLSRVLKGHERVVTWVAFHPSADLLVSTSWDGTIALWSPMTGYRWCHWPGAAHQATLSADGRWLGLIGNYSRVRHLELEPAGEFQWLATASSAGDLAGDFSPDGRWLAIGAEGGLVIWDTRTWRRVLQRAIGRVKWVTFLPRAQTLLTVSGSTVSEWPLNMDESGELQLGPARKLASDPLLSMCSCSDDGMIVATAQKDIRVEDRRGSQSFPLAESEWAYGVAVSPDGRWVAGVIGQKGRGSWLRIWELPSRKAVRVLTTDNPRTQMRFSPDGRWLFGGTERAFCCWEVGTWRQAYVSPRDDFTYGSGCVAISRNGHWAALGNAGPEVQVVNLPTLAQALTLQSVPGFPVSLSPDGSWLLIQTVNGNFGVWDLHRINQELGPMRLGWRDQTAPAGAR